MRADESEREYTNRIQRKAGVLPTESLSERYAHRHAPDAPRYDRLEAILYRLMRDHLPVGTLAALVDEHAEFEVFTLSNPGLAMAARDLADAIR